MVDETNQRIIKFIIGYSQKSFNQVKFDWNGRHPGDGFEDPNAEFRESVIDYLVNHSKTGSKKLLEDLFMEEAKCCAESWGHSGNFSFLASELLLVGGMDSILHLLAWKDLSMDTYAACEYLYIPLNFAQKLLEQTNHKLKTITDEKQQSLYEEAKEYLEDIIWQLEQD